MSKKIESLWTNAKTARPMRENSIVFVDDCGNIHRGIYTFDRKVISSGLTETKNGYETVVNTYKWSDIRYWIYATELEDKFI